SSGNAGFGGTGAYSANSSDVFVMALNAANGEPVASFGNGGVQTFGGPGDDRGYALALSGSSLFVTGKFSGRNGIPTGGGPDAFVLALNASTGAVLTGFGTNGAQTFGGAEDDAGNAIVTAGSAVYIAGTFTSVSAGVGGPGNLAARGPSDAFVLA